MPPTYPPTIPVLAFFLPEIADAFTTDTEWELVGGVAHSAMKSGPLSAGDFSTETVDTLVLIPFRVKDRDYELIVATPRLLDFLPHPGDLSMDPGSYSFRDVAWTE